LRTARRDATLDVARSFDFTIVERLAAPVDLGLAMCLLLENEKASGTEAPRPRPRCLEKHAGDYHSGTPEAAGTGAGRVDARRVAVYAPYPVCDTRRTVDSRSQVVWPVGLLGS
jgi:hypothetical protein